MENENITPIAEASVIEEPIVPQVSVEPEKKSNLFKIVIIAIGILIVAGLSLNAYLMFSKKETVTKPSDSPVIVTPTSDTTANWTTYANPTYGYSIKFPDTYEVPPQTEKQKSQLGVDNNMCVTLKNDNNNNCYISISVWEESVDEVVTRFGPTDGSQSEDYTLGVIKGKIIIYKMGESTTQAKIFLPKPNVTNETITLTYTNFPGDIETSKLIDQILSTFKFTDSSSSIDITNWKTYADSDYHLSIKYPSDWKFNLVKANDSTTNKTATFESPMAKMIATTYPLMNECMKVISQKNIKLDVIDFVEKYYQGVGEGMMCQGGDNISKLQIWVTPTSAGNFGYNFQFEYSLTNRTEAESLISQILSTFRFD
jgi:hypothetical protein